MKTLEKVQTGILSAERRDFLKKSGALAIMSAFGVGFFRASWKIPSELGSRA
ncbi:twin-arginine translocation signal domain-containing protein [Cecembia calidifontis]|uniref:Secreted protein n=1 Tax=Cecembia calidifontis TaxID=1187080 RepID=A0A4Q7PAX8_9BACT|nr:twin-arginine translocation signal domain-containing protein [Cecembia calidifontis]RZS97446.1 secreted protein [Cecembia calidifontis]